MIIDKLKNLMPIDDKLLSSLYDVSSKTIIIVFILNILITYYLFPVLGNVIYLWSSVFFIVLTGRMLLYYLYKNNYTLYSIRQWYALFVISAFSTAAFFSVLSLFIISIPNNILTQLLIVMLLIGYAAGSYSALSSDIRISIGYILIIIIPLVVAMWITGSHILTVLSIFVVLYLISLILVQLQHYKKQIKVRNITQELQHISIRDDLTQLLNRRGFINDMKECINKTSKTDTYSILFYFVLDQFKIINDTLGHHIGDNILVEVGRRLKKLTLPRSFMSRYGGDEFVILLPSTHSDANLAKETAETCANTIHTIFSESFTGDEYNLHVKSSMGVVIIEPSQNDKIEDILRRADLAMYRSKKTGCHISFYDATLDQHEKEQLTLQHDLSYAIKNRELKLYFQPIVSIKNDTLYAAELLMRWEHQTKGLLTPDSFIPLAIKAGLLSSITWWIIEETCKQIAWWQKNNMWNLKYISININANNLIEEGFTDKLMEIVHDYSIDPAHIVLEITERSLIDKFTHTQEVISSLDEHGITCAIDDFGVGYSSLSYLQKLSCHILKIDRAFVESIHNNAKELALLSTIILIGEEFDYTIIVEGIEEEEQKSILKHFNQKLLYQGYLYSRPLVKEQFTQKFLKSI